MYRYNHYYEATAMSVRKSSSIQFVALFIILLMFCAGCAPRQTGATNNGFYASGLANCSIQVAPPLSLAATGAFSAPVVSDVNVRPGGSLRYAVFTDDNDGPVLRHAHAAICELGQYAWRWEKETWALPEAVYYGKEQMGGKYWTVQILPISAQKDWFSALWRENGRQTPEFWIAKRWSSTPEDHIRIVAEYREAAPDCMLERLKEAGARPMGAPSLKGKTLLRDCAEALKDFSLRADAVFTLDRMNQPAPAPAEALRGNLPARPGAAPDMPRLFGRAEMIDRGGHDYRP